MSKVVLKVKISQMMPSSYRIKEEILVVLQLVLHFFFLNLFAFRGETRQVAKII